MDRAKYLQMNFEELYQHLISDVMEDPPDGKILLDELTTTARYREEYEFRTFVETVRALVFLLHGDFSQVISHATELIDRSTALKMWQLVSTNWNLLGSAYSAIGISERALECYFNVIKIENTHNLVAITPTAYNNIALIYLNLEAHEIAYRYFQLALEALERGKSKIPRYYSKLVSYLSNLVPLLCLMNRNEEIPAVFEHLNEVDKNKVNSDAMYSYYIAQMYHAFYRFDYDEGRNLYRNILQFDSGNNFVRKIEFINSYIGLCSLFELDYDFYRDALLSLEKIQEAGHPLNDARVYGILKEYYKEIGDQVRFEKTVQKYIELLEQNREDIRKGQLDSLEVVTSLIYNKENLESVQTENNELQLIAEEAVRNKNALQEAYHRIEMINAMGKKLISSLKIEEVIDLVYKYLKENLPLKDFILVVIEPESECLRSVAYYENDELLEGFTIPFDHPDSIFVQCYKEDRSIISGNIYEDTRFKTQNLLWIGEDQSRSVVFMPLKVGDRMIGLCSIQDAQIDAYSEKDIAFLEDLLPYLSIALNNAIYSWNLEKEIQSHLQTQRRLKKANSILSRLSSMDGLTQIGNRRDFEFRILDLIKASYEEDTTISVFMFDIDNFKMYNDTYGHLEGDEALKKVARIIYRYMEKVGGLSARFGGEEFIGACTGLDETQSKMLADQIRQEIFDLKIENREAPLKTLSVSVGVAIAKKFEVSKKSAIMRWADISLYQAKNTGKNKVVVKQIRSDEELPDRLN